MKGNPAVEEIVKAFLIKNGYSGLYGDGCGCELDDLMCCDSEGVKTCAAGYKVKCTDKCECEHGKIGNDDDWHIQSEKPKED